MKVFFHFGKYPVGYALFFTMLLTASMFACALLGTLRWSAMLAFSTTDPLSASWWRVVTYSFVVVPNLGGILQLIFLGYFGDKLEQLMEERDFLVLLLLLWLAPPLLAWCGMPIGHSSWMGCRVMSFGFFLAYVCHCPNLPGFFGIPLKWFGFIGIAAEVIQLIAFRQWPYLLVNVAVWCAVWWWMKRQGYSLPWRLADDIGLQWSPKSRPSRKKSSMSTAPKLHPRTSVPLHSSSAVDRILDKVSREGIHSLTKQERKLLQDTSDELKG